LYKIYNIEYIYELGIHIFIEPYFPITEQQKTTQDLDLSVVLNDIPKILNVQDNLYYLRGLINFIPPISKNLKAVGHYVAICWKETTMR
jgi:hypothetical protein